MSPAPPSSASVRHVVVMGVAGSGKTTVARGLADRLGLAFVDADDLHPPANVARMRAGVPLTDADRAGWLAAVARVLATARPPGVVVACSALRRVYRDRLRHAAPGLRLVHLHGDPSLLAARLTARRGHFLPPSLLPSQLATLEPPAPDEPAAVLDITAPPEALVEAAATALATATADAPPPSTLP